MLSIENSGGLSSYYLDLRIGFLLGDLDFFLGEDLVFLGDLFLSLLLDLLYLASNMSTYGISKFI